MTNGATLTGITSDSGECDRCGKELGRIYEVSHADGSTATYGRKCCAIVTGYRPNNIDKLARMAARQAETSARRVEIEAEFPGAGEWDIRECATNDALWSGKPGIRFADWRDFMTQAG
jgi:hypothetical protein